MGRYNPPPFKEVLEDILKSEGMSAEELAVAIGLSHFAFRQILTGRAKYPSYPTLVKLANYLDCSIEYFFK